MPDEGPPKSEGDLDALAASFHARDDQKAALTEGADLAPQKGGEAHRAGLDEGNRKGSLQDEGNRRGYLDDPLDDDGLSASELRRTELGRRLARRRGYSVAAQEKKTRRLLSSWGIGGVLLLSLWSLAGTLPDVRYWLSNGPPIDLGHMGGYHLERAHDGAFARVEGVASPKRGTYSRMFGEHELVPLIASRILVDRSRAPDESMRGFGFNYSGEGRLVRAEEGSKWDAVRTQFVEAGELARAGDVWLLEENVSPHRGWRTPGEVIVWLFACLICAAVLALRARRSLAARS